MRLPVVLTILMFLMLVGSLTTVKAEANYITKSVAVTKFNQGEMFTVTLSAAVTEPFTYELIIRDDVIYPAMQIIEASYFVTGGVPTPVLEQYLDHVRFTSSIIPPVSVTITYKVMFSMAGTFYLPAASLSVRTATKWTTYVSEAFGPFTVVSNAELVLSGLLKDLDARITSVDGEVASISAKVESVSGDIVTIKTDVYGDLKGRIQSVKDDVMTVKTDVGIIKVELPKRFDQSTTLIEEGSSLVQQNATLIQQSILYSQIAASLAAIACLGAWVAVIMARKKKA